MDAKTLARQSGTNFYYSFALLSREKREALYALYNLCRRLDDAADDAASPEAGAQDLRTWREEIERTFDGRPSHPLTVAFYPHLTRYRIPQKYLQDLITGMEMDLQGTRYETFEDLRLYCYRVASVVGLMSIEIFGYRNPATRAYAETLGLALQLTNILRDLEPDARRGRVYLPGEDLRRFGYSEDNLREGVYNEAFIELIRFQCERARRYYRQAEELLPPEDRGSMLPARAMGGIYFRLLEKIERARYDVFSGRITLSKPEKLWIALKTWMIS